MRERHLTQKQFDVLTCLERSGKAMTQRELAERIHVTDKAVSKWERGESIPDVVTLVNLAEQLEITVNDLLSDPNALPEQTGAVQQSAETLRGIYALCTGVPAAAYLVVLALLALCWFLWLQRYVVYTRDEGAKLDFSTSSQYLTGPSVQKPEQSEPIGIYYNEGDNQISTSTEMTRISGYYVSGAELEDDLSGILAQIRQLPKGAAVMVDVKSAYGNFFYSSTGSSSETSASCP